MNEIQEIKEALAKATPGKWIKDVNVSDEPDAVFDPTETYPIAELAFENSQNDAHLIAHAPTWLQQCIDTIEVYEKDKRYLRELLEKADAECEALEKENKHAYEIMMSATSDNERLRQEIQRLLDKLQQIDGQRQDAEQEVERLKKELSFHADEEAKAQHTSEQLRNQLEKAVELLQPFGKNVIYTALRYFYKQGLFRDGEYDDLELARATVDKIAKFLPTCRVCGMNIDPKIALHNTGVSDCCDDCRLTRWDEYQSHIQGKDDKQK